MFSSMRKKLHIAKWFIMCFPVTEKWNFDLKIVSLFHCFTENLTIQKLLETLADLLEESHTFKHPDKGPVLKHVQYKRKILPISQLVLTKCFFSYLVLCYLCT